MNSQILIGLLMSVLPFIELRGGLPIIVEYAVRNGVFVWPYFLIVLILNVSIIFFIFIFFDLFHGLFMRMKWYRSFFGKFLFSFRKKVSRAKSKMDKWGYLGLMFFVAVPLPGTGAWTGTMVAWIMNLDRLKSFIAIAFGVIIAGLIILLLSFGFFSGLYI